ncbi:MAG: lipopolysaccharide biosynthesis protein, partial [Vicinamibacterales bacterium]
LNTLAFLGSNLRAIFTFLVARLLGGPVLGTFGVAWAVADLASKFGTLGLDYSVMAFVARSEGIGDRAGSRRIMRIALRAAVPGSIAAAAIGGGLALASRDLWQVRPDLALTTAVMLLGVPGIVLYRVSNGLSRGMKVMQHDLYSRGLTESLATTAALLVAYAAGARLLAPVLAAIAGTLASGLVAWRLATRLYRQPGPPPPAAASDASAGLLRASLPIALYDLLNIGVMRIDVIMLGLFVGRAPSVTLETVGIYAACVEVAGGLRKLSQAFTPILTPVLAEQLALGRQHEAEKSYGYVARWMLAVLLPAVVVLGVSGGAILRVFGEGFEVGGTWVAIAGAACALNAFVGLGETILMIQRPTWNVFNTAVAFVAAVALNLVLIPRWGPLGAAIGMLVPYTIQGILRGLEIGWWLGWRWPWRTLLRPWLATLGALPVAIAVRALGTGLAAEAAAGLLFVAAYLVAWRIVGLNDEDRAVLARLRGGPRDARTGGTSVAPNAR